MKTKTLTDADGNRITYDTATDQILKRVDKHGFIYNSKGVRTGHISGKEYVEGYFYD
jgi:hypothetical protein